MSPLRLDAGAFCVEANMTTATVLCGTLIIAALLLWYLLARADWGKSSGRG